MSDWRCKYTIDMEAGRFTREDLEGDDKAGGCDAFVFVSMLYPEDGSYSQVVLSFDGRADGAELDDTDLFKVWSMLGAQLAGSESLSSNRRALCQSVLDAMRRAIGVEVPVP